MGLRIICILTSAIAALGGLTIAHAASSQKLQVQIVDARGVPVRDAVVEVDVSGRATTPIRFPWQMAIAQKNQAFVPGTLIIARGSTVAFPNLDNVRHSIYSFSKAAQFSIELYGRDQTRRQTFPIVGPVALGCNIHDQMRGYIRVVDTPYAAKTDSNGFAKFDGLPAATASVTVWHPRLRAPKNELQKSVRLGSGADLIKLPVNLR